MDNGAVRMVCPGFCKNSKNTRQTTNPRAASGPTRNQPYGPGQSWVDVIGILNRNSYPSLSHRVVGWSRQGKQSSIPTVLFTLAAVTAIF